MQHATAYVKCTMSYMYAMHTRPRADVLRWYMKTNNYEHSHATSLVSSRLLPHKSREEWAACMSLWKALHNPSLVSLLPELTSLEGQSHKDNMEFYSSGQTSRPEICIHYCILLVGRVRLAESKGQRDLLDTSWKHVVCGPMEVNSTVVSLPGGASSDVSCHFPCRSDPCW